jgi:H+/Na+-translocating ferredoxin:NAD+ oxidoreductase subunit B
MADPNPYTLLAEKLDALPNGFPPAEDGSHLRLLECLFTPEEAALAAELSRKLETPAAIAARLQADPGILRNRLKDMARKGLISAGRADGGMGYALMPFVVGFYEMQMARMDSEMARRVEDYFQASFRKGLAIQPPFQRVVPVRESIQADICIAPFESAADIVNRASAWSVTDCVCRKQTALIGRPCKHPVEVCMVISSTPGAFHGNNGVRELTREEALDVLRQSAEAGLVHSVGNTREGNWYICNCCTCSCAILRGVAEGGIASAVAHSGFVCQVEPASCDGCGLCSERCPFGAISVDGTARVEPVQCAGCGVCAIACPNGSLSLVRRKDGEAALPPRDDTEWREERAAWRTQHPG